MPSKALRSFENHLLKDVNNLKSLHSEKYSGAGRPNSVLTRSGVFLLCAAWEFYCEEVIKEGLDHLLRNYTDPTTLPVGVRNTLIKAVKDDKHDFAALRLAGDGWKTYLTTHAEQVVGRLNTPNKSNLEKLFDDFLSIDVSSVFNENSEQLKDFIGKRGDIAHKGVMAGHVSMRDLESDTDFICGLVSTLDNFLIEPLQSHCGFRPWNKRSINSE